MNPSRAATTRYRPGSSASTAKAPSGPLTELRSVPLSTLCAVIRTCANNFLLAESRVTPPTPPDNSCPEAEMGSTARCNAMQAGTTAKTSKLRVISILFEDRQSLSFVRRVPTRERGASDVRLYGGGSVQRVANGVTALHGSMLFATESSMEQDS